ncbi:hypothetical protein VC83_08323 [Pseudogymnoascus destructans]|uniref:HD/PDEase domain-containing protein n=2 Tax=Pseudogymnoascus destructans TaxID=655981 RepID=L8GDB6_PSED2|nr:uncharacterized protein VC83_08323 [Pseudogymnoascus destructans]ELR10698.1 hypothetical protein GMDG_04959 [Pseudogymnoascus destructans 20631-21]OAF55395.1 hypothetical protein VC83_08323 [Pseudogymnoascus destructans]
MSVPADVRPDSLQADLLRHGLPHDLIHQVTAYVKSYMAPYDRSHDFAHVLRVLGLSQILCAQDPARYDRVTTILAALLHDVGDRKYLLPHQDSATMVRDVLLSFGSTDEFADKVQTIASAVSYSSEVKDPQVVRDVIAKYPELEVVQDADRLDAIGAIGIGRVFTFGAAKGRGMETSLDHFEDKLVKVAGMMKSELGGKMARERTKILLAFRKMWEGEVSEAEAGLEGLKEIIG